MRNNNYGLPKSQKPVVKVILVGNSGVGKTCLISAYFRQSYDSTSQPTVSPAYSSSEIRRKDGTVLVLQIWDTAGQERYQAISEIFFRDSDVAFVCFPCGDESFLESVPQWIQKIKQDVPNCIIYLVLTKSDLCTQEVIDKAKEDAASRFAEYEPLGIFATSAVSKSGVEDVFVAAAEAGAPHVFQREIQEETSGKKCC